MEDIFRPGMCFSNGERQSSESGAESDGSDHRMLQSEQHPSSPSAILFPGSQIFGADYENMKLQATKGMYLDCCLGNLKFRKR